MRKLKKLKRLFDSNKTKWTTVVLNKYNYNINANESVAATRSIEVENSSLEKNEIVKTIDKRTELGLLIYKDAVELTVKHPIWYELPVQAGQTLVIKAASLYLNLGNTTDRKAVLMINSYDENGKEVDIPCGQMAKSESLHAYFKYLPSTNNNIKELHSFVVPSDVSYIQLGLSAFNTIDKQKVFIKSLIIKSKLDEYSKHNNKNIVKEQLESSGSSMITTDDVKKVNDGQYFSESKSIKNLHFGLPINDDAIELFEKAPLWYRISVQAGQRLVVNAASLYINMKNIMERKAVLMINSYDENGNEVNLPCGQMARSEILNAYFKYLPSTDNNIEELHSFVVPNGVSYIQLGFCAFNTFEEQKVFVKSIRINLETDKPQINNTNNFDSKLIKVEAIRKTEVLLNNEPFTGELTITNNNRYEIANFKISESADTLEVSATSIYQLKNNITSRKAVVLLEFLDAENNRIIDISGIGFSTLFNQFFRYLNHNYKSTEQDLGSIVKIKVPDKVVSVNLTIASMSLKANEHIDVRFQVQCYSEIEEKEAIHQKLKSQPLPSPIIYNPNNNRYTSDLTIISILDEFTTECLAHEVNLIKVTQKDWQSQLEQVIPDFLLVESCWRGNDGDWGTLTKGSGGAKKLSPLLKYCKENNIPTVFWNKEDPPHYEKFGAIARLFDVAITTDINMVDRYKKDFGIDVHPLSFAAQPKIHNPVSTIARLNKAVFAGSYYKNKSKRCADFDDIMAQVENANIDYDIFDRNYYNNIENFIYPEQYQSHIIGNLTAEDVWKAHKGYKYQINMNTVQDSSTMFARRVYESLASGTPVISNDSVGVRQLFGDLVIMPNKIQTITEQLVELESSPLIYEERVRHGVRRVMREHTYGHRIQQVCKLLDIDVEVEVPSVTLAITVNSEADIARAKNIFDVQTASAKQLFIELENFDNAHQFLNNSNDTISYAMKLGKSFYDKESQYYGSDKVLKCNVNESIPAEALEDFIYWGEL